MKLLVAVVGVLSGLLAGGIVQPSPATAQNYLGSFLQVQRDNHIRMMQQRAIRKRQQERRRVRAAPNQQKPVPRPRPH